MSDSWHTLLGLVKAALLSEGRLLAEARTHVDDLNRQLIQVQQQIESLSQLRGRCNRGLGLGGSGALLIGLCGQEARYTANLRKLKRERHALSGQIRVGRQRVADLELNLAACLGRQANLIRTVERRQADARSRSICRREAELLELAAQRCPKSGHPV